VKIAYRRPSPVQEFSHRLRGSYDSLLNQITKAIFPDDGQAALRDHSTLARHIESFDHAMKLNSSTAFHAVMLRPEGECMAERLGALDEAIFFVERREGGTGSTRISAVPGCE
jgi:hypothetical protein